MVEEVGAWGEVGVMVAVAELVDGAEGVDEGGDEGEVGTVGLLGGCAWVADVGGHGAEVAVAADGVADDGAEGAGEVDEGCVVGHGGWVLICLMLISGYVVC